jgi:plexin A
VNVTIGSQQCNVTALASRQLICWPPPDPPAPTDENGVAGQSKLPLVVVRVGSLRYPLGYLHYSFGRAGGISSQETRGPFPPEALGGAGAGAALLILIALGILVAYRRKSSQAEREYKRIQIQMDTLESNVRSECKQGTAF